VGADPLRRKLDAIRALADDPTSQATVEALRVALSDKANHVVAAAAKHVATHAVDGLGPAMVDAYLRFAKAAPKQQDPGCAAKVALVSALSDRGHPDEAPFLHGVRHVQLEPAYGGPVDTAVALRGAALMGLVGLSHSSFPLRAAELLGDPEPRCRADAAQCLHAWADPNLGGALIRLRLRAGEGEPEVLESCFAALLALGGDEAVDHVVGWVRSRTSKVAAECAALALGSARVEAALPALADFVAARADAEGRRLGLVAIGLVRTEASLAWLLERLGTGPRGDRALVLEALAVHAADPRAAERIAAAADQVGVGREWARIADG
jgi:hypothetical protein